jgi:hypothetical protein
MEESVIGKETQRNHKMPRELVTHYSGSFFKDFVEDIDRTIMSPFINQQPFYPQTSLEKLPRTAMPLTEIPML